MRVGLMGTRGVPARYGGFETAVQEVGSRLASRGHQVVVYCRGGDPRQTTFLGMELVHLPAIHRQAVETLNHTVSSALHVRKEQRYDAIVLFNAANALTLPVMRRHATGVALHVDGLEWKRAKWNGPGRAWYLLMERYGAKHADELIADAQAIQTYYTTRYARASTYIPYGAPLRYPDGTAHVLAHGLVPGRYHLVVARLEPENHVDVALEAYLARPREWPLVVVGSVPYDTAHSRRLDELAARSPGIRLLGAVWDPDELDELWVQAGSYVHGHSVGGTNPALLRAMGAGSAVAAYDVVFNREVLGSTGSYYDGVSALASLLDSAEEDPDAWRARGDAARERVAARYDWERVTDDYEALCRRLADGTPA